MALRGKPPETIQKRLKMLLYGPAGVGKSTAATQFAKNYFIDTEKGAENDKYVENMKRSGSAYYFTTQFDDMLTEVKSLMTEKHDFRTVTIDPLSVPYADLIDKTTKRIAEREGLEEDDEKVTGFGRCSKPADRKTKHLCNLLVRLDMNCIVTAHAKTKWLKDGKAILDGGQTFDCYAKVDYMFDVVVELQKRGDKRFGVVRKTRHEGFPDGASFEFSYDEVADRYGRELIERGATVESLATADQIAELAHLIELLKVAPDETDKWLDKAGAEDWSEMPTAAIGKCIEFLKKRITQGAA